jgi:hypothetical protein
MQMRRCFSIFLILFFGLGPLSALAEGTEDATLPSCCRRHGAHHCAMSAQISEAQKMAMRAGVANDKTPEVSVPSTCPLYHGPALYMLMPAHALTAAPASLPSDLALAPAPASARTDAFSCPTRAHAGRGPPVANLI